MIIFLLLTAIQNPPVHDLFLKCSWNLKPYMANTFHL